MVAAELVAAEPIDSGRSNPAPRRADRVRASGAWVGAYLSSRRRMRMSGPQAVLFAAIVAWIAIFATLLVWRHDRYGTYDHDLGIWDQAVWLLANGESFNTVRGLDVFGFHVSPALYLFVPFYRLGAGVNFLNVSMVVVVCGGAWPVFRLARLHLRNEWHALVLALAFLVNYAAQWMLHETFHPEVMAITPMLFAFLAATEGRWRAYAGWLVLAVAWKEDIALAVLMVGVVLVIRGRRSVRGSAAGPGDPSTRLAGALTIVAAIGWFFVATRVVIPAFSSEGVFTEALFGDLGSTPTEIVGNAVTDPELVTSRLAKSHPENYVRELTGSFGFTAVFSPLALLIGLPQTAINLLAMYNFFWTTKVHYAAMPLVGTTIASVEGVACFQRPAVRRALLGLVAVGAFFTAVSWGLSPVSEGYGGPHWRRDPVPMADVWDATVALPGPDDAVSSTYFLAPHLGHRSRNYTFPNPWIPINWGVRDENRPDPEIVDWLMVNPSALRDEDRWVLANALANPGERLERSNRQVIPPEVDVKASMDRTKWEIVVDRPDLLVTRRIR